MGTKIYQLTTDITLTNQDRGCQQANIPVTMDFFDWDYNYKSATQIYHNARWTLVPCTGCNLIKCLRSGKIPKLILFFCILKYDESHFFGFFRIIILPQLNLYIIKYLSFSVTLFISIYGFLSTQHVSPCVGSDMEVSCEYFEYAVMDS